MWHIVGQYQQPNAVYFYYYYLLLNAVYAYMCAPQIAALVLWLHAC